ncbi:MAG TPA: FAD-dependent oxidoreductase [Rhizomicrobium sp.]|nr:FAD-dependent oxidoreductase [Rhizomicrobium sp.]
MTGPRDLDFAVIGGGVIGAAIAFGLARLGRQVTVFDEGDVVHRPSRGNFSLVWVQSKGLGMTEYALWSRKAAGGWRRLAEELRNATGIDVAFTQPGGLHLVLSETELERRALTFEKLWAQAGADLYPYEMLDRPRLQRLLPAIGPDVCGASYCPLDGQVNSLRLLRALHTALARLGVTYLSNHSIAAIKPRAVGFDIITPNGQWRTHKVVLAAGHGNRRLAPMVGLEAPIRPQRGEIMITEKLRPFLAYPTINVRQTDEGGVQVGDSVEEVGFDDGVRTDVLSVIASRAVRMFPVLERANVVRSWGALRVMPQDGFPIYDASTVCPGAFLATAHSGVTMASNHVFELPPMLVAGRLADELSAFGARRFHAIPQ